jgi:DnaJ-like protein C11, C-terminal
MKTIAAAVLFACACFSAVAADPATNPSPRLVIVKAVYGDLSDSNATINVTKQVASSVRNDTVSLPVNHDSFEDPASGASKELKVDYTVDGKAKSKTVKEGDVLNLSASGE